MIRRLSFIILLWSLASIAVGQQVSGLWEALSNGPSSPSARHDDITFIDEQMGWVVNGRGEVHQTRDGGVSWQLLYEDPTVYFRSVSFASVNRGWMGGIYSDGNVLFETFDGGHSWINVTGRLKSPPGGVCGIQALSEQVVYGVGAFYGGPWFVKTTDGGQSWSSTVLGTEARTLIDLHFKNTQEGIVIGGTANIDDGLRGDAIVLRTVDGGANWTTVHRTTHGSGVGGEWAWKISFPTDRVGYISIEYTGNTSFQEAKYLKTIDGGVTWSEHFIPTSTEISGLQAIGFVTEDLGWASGRGTTSETRDGGLTWERLPNYDPTSAPDGQLDGATNRIFIVRPTVAYAVGKYVYKFDGSVGTATMAAIAPVRTRSFQLDQNFPNPLTSSTTIGYTLFENLNVRISIHDILGRRVHSLENSFQMPGTYRLSWDGRNGNGDRVTSGTYLVLMDIGDRVEMKQVVVLRE